ncbi:MAG: response regulator [Chloroflexi bacterium]|nr:response regulator [Chloroflexota bacterium]
MVQFSSVSEPPVVVVAEDSPVQALHLKELLTRAGLRLLWAPNGVECLKLVSLAQPALVLLDLEMPEKNGLQTCFELKQDPETADIPVILFTKHDDPEFSRLGFEFGAVEFIPKDAFADAVLLETLVQLGIITREASKEGLRDNGD